MILLKPLGDFKVRDQRGIVRTSDRSDIADVIEVGV